MNIHPLFHSILKRTNSNQREISDLNMTIVCDRATVDYSELLSQLQENELLPETEFCTSNTETAAKLNRVHDSAVHLVESEQRSNGQDDLSTRLFFMARYLADKIRKGETDLLFFDPSISEALFGMLRLPVLDLPEINRFGAGIGAMACDGYDRLLYIVDTMGVAEPGIEYRVQSGQSAVKQIRKLGVDSPKISVLAAVEAPSPGMPVTIEAEQVAGKLIKAGIEAHGPLSVDLSVSRLAVEKKKVKGTVPGHADLFLAPNLTVARSVYQASTGFCNSVGGMAWTGEGLSIACPVSQDTEEAFYSLALAIATGTNGK